MLKVSMFINRWRSVKHKTPKGFEYLCLCSTENICLRMHLNYQTTKHAGHMKDKFNSVGVKY